MKYFSRFMESNPLLTTILVMTVMLAPLPANAFITMKFLDHIERSNTESRALFARFEDLTKAIMSEMSQTAREFGKIAETFKRR